MPATYNCTGCNEVFDTKAERKNHFRNVCQAFVNVTEWNGTIHPVERIDGKFICPRCPKAFTRSDTLITHWKVCMTKDGSEMDVDEEDLIVQCLRYDGEYNLAVCIKCEYGLPQEWIAPHFKNIHKLSITEERTQWLEEWIADNGVKTLDECETWKESVSLLRCPVIGVKVHVGSGCPGCKFSHYRAREVTSHMRTEHNFTDGVVPILCSIQKVFSSHLRGCLRVNTTPTEEDDNADEGLLALRQFSAEFQRFEQEDQRSAVVVVPEDQRLRSAWMTKCDWDVLLEGMPWKAVKDMAEKPDHKDPLYKVIAGVKLYLAKVCNHLRKTGLTLRHQMLEGVKYIRILIWANKSDHELGKTFHALQEKTTIDSYAEMMALFIIFCLRATDDNVLSWSWTHPFSTEQVDSLGELWHLINEPGQGVSEETWCPVIHKTLKWFVNCSVEKKVVAEVEWPLYRFLIAISINSTADGFGEPGNVPHVVKKLVYCIRANIFEQARLLSESDEEHSDDDSGDERPTLDYDGGMFGLKKYIIDKGQTPFNAIRYISNVAGNVASNDPTEGFVSWNINPAEPERYDVLSINNKSFRFSSLTKFVDELLTKTERILFLDILSGVRLPDTDFANYEPAESFKNRNYHESAFTEPANVYVNHKQDVVKAWLENRRKRATMVLDVTDEGIKWKRSAVMSWLDKCLLYLQLLLVLLQLTWGGPARIAEMAVLRITNGQDERRNMYFDGTWIMFLFRYNKTRAIVGRDRLIPRYPPPAVVKQLIYYFTFVRPTVSYFMKHFNLPGKNQIDEYMFVDHKVGRWTDKMMYRRFDQITVQHGIGMITTSIYRQAAQLIMDKLVKFKWELPDENHISDESFGHSSRQAIESYAVEIGIGELVQKNDKAWFKLGGFKWHVIMIPNPSRRGPLPKRGIDDVDSPSNNGESSQQPATSRPRISNSALITILPPLQPDISELTARTYLSSIKPIVNPDVEMKPKTLVALRTLLNSPAATFKSLYQAKAVQLFLNRETDLLIILPTGGGKSLTFEIAPILEPEGTTVLILPFIALMDEMKQRLKKVMPKFRAEQWHKDRRTDSSLPHILLISIEEAVSMEFQSFIQIANANHELRRWVVDEFHVLITQNHFRPIFPRLVTTIRLIPVPFVGLSATIPDSYIDQIRLTMSSVNTTIVRSPTDRPNLRYGTYRLRYDTEEELDKELCRQIKEAWDGTIEDDTEDETRFIVFTHSAKAAEHFSNLVNKKSEELGITAVVYHSKMDRSAKEGAYQKWLKGKAKLLVGTGAIGAGMDYSYVRRTWHRGFASSNINFIQEMGRAGRDGEPAACVLVYSSVIEEACKKFIDLQEVAEHKSYVEEQGCLRAYLTKFIDGARIDCMSSPGAQMCMPCTRVMKDATLASGPVTARGNGTMYQGELNQLAFQDNMLSRSELVEKVRMLMDAIQGVCGVCWFRRKTGKNRTDQSMNHDLGKCAYMGGICMRCFCRGHGATKCPEFRESLRFKEGCCWKCGFPQYLFGQLLHGDNMTGQCDKPGLQDRLAGIAWSCWRDTLWQERVRKRFPELLRVRDDAFMEWLGQLGKEKVVNAVWLALFFFQKSEEELDSLDGINLNL